MKLDFLEKNQGPEPKTASMQRIKSFSSHSNSSDYNSSEDPFASEPSQSANNSQNSIKDEDCPWTLQNNHQAQGKILIIVSEQSQYKD